MLVLTRKLHQSVMIGDDICVTIVRVAGGRVRLGIRAPERVLVLREELAPPPPEDREHGPTDEPWP